MNEEFAGIDLTPLLSDPREARQARIERAMATDDSTPFQVAEYRATIARLISKDESHGQRVDELVTANNAEIERRRVAEAEAEQLRVDLTLARNECARLRGVLSEEALNASQAGDDETASRLRYWRFPQEAAS
jgi:hypothetical protein